MMIQTRDDTPIIAIRIITADHTTVAILQTKNDCTQVNNLRYVILAKHMNKHYRENMILIIYQRSTCIHQYLLRNTEAYHSTNFDLHSIKKDKVCRYDTQWQNQNFIVHVNIIIVVTFHIFWTRLTRFSRSNCHIRRLLDRQQLCSTINALIWRINNFMLNYKVDVSEAIGEIK